MSGQPFFGWASPGAQWAAPQQAPAHGVVMQGTAGAMFFQQPQLQQPFMASPSFVPQSAFHSEIHAGAARRARRLGPTLTWKTLAPACTSTPSNPLLLPLPVDCSDVKAGT